MRSLADWSVSGGVFRTPLAEPPPGDDEEVVLHFGGLATLCDVYLNDVLVLQSTSMYTTHTVDVGRLLTGDDELVIHVHPLDLTTPRKPRARWRPAIVPGGLRFYRTTFLGHAPGLQSGPPPVGPWRPVTVERRRGIAVDRVRVRASADGLVEVEAAVRSLGGSPSGALPDGPLPAAAVEVGGVRAALEDGRARIVVPDAERWWPHTHGTPALYPVTLRVGDHAIDAGRVGFRSIEGLPLRVNGVPVFARGAIWTPDPDPRPSLEKMRDAGMNMVRVVGTTAYETREFHEICDELGILVWQDLMFANMDYPDGDATFIASVTAELQQQLELMLPHPSLAAICGNSEVEQQAAMWGAPRERWSPRLFHEIVPALLAERRADVGYWPSSAHGGSFPHQVNQGTTSYYGVGAYLRPLDDARRSELKFATECLGFANVPEDDALAAMPQGLALRVHHPDWKQRAPRDLGAGWDFDDVRDAYLQKLFDVDPVQLRYADHDRYLHLSRLVSGEVRAATFAEWRRGRSTCNGALVWFLRDLWAGAGWGLIDALGQPKAALHALSRVLQPTLVAISDEGNNGLTLHVVNERAAALDATLALTLYRAGEVVIAQGRRAIRVAERSALELSAAELLDGFHDLSYAYRFGPPSYDVAVATLHRSDESVLMHATYFPSGLAVRQTGDVGLKAVATPSARGYDLKLSSRAFARWVTVRADGYECNDQYFHLLPGVERVVSLQAQVSPSRALRGQVHALNASAPTQIELSA